MSSDPKDSKDVVPASEAPTTIDAIMAKIKDDTRSVPLGNCTFALSPTDLGSLTISWTPHNANPSDPQKTFQVNLNNHIGNVGGQLVWGGTDFSESCDDIKLIDNTTVLSAKCRHTHFTDSNRNEIRLRDSQDTAISVVRELDLKDHIIYDRALDGGSFNIVAGDPDFSRVISSASWMKYAIITQPDMGSFLRQKPVQNAVGDVAERTVAQIMHQTELVLAQVVKAALDAIKKQAKELIADELDRLAKRAALTTGYASGFGAFAQMHDAAYHVMAEHSEPFKSLRLLAPPPPTDEGSGDGGSGSGGGGSGDGGSGGGGSGDGGDPLSTLDPIAFVDAAPYLRPARSTRLRPTGPAAHHCLTPHATRLRRARPAARARFTRPLPAARRLHTRSPHAPTSQGLTALARRSLPAARTRPPLGARQLPTRCSPQAPGSPNPLLAASARHPPLRSPPDSHFLIPAGCPLSSACRSTREASSSPPAQHAARRCTGGERTLRMGHLTGRPAAPRILACARAREPSMYRRWARALAAGGLSPGGCGLSHIMVVLSRGIVMACFRLIETHVALQTSFGVILTHSFIDW
ncbi:hypothetical protein GGX14DRAFT_388386 [Mycena pura]|uniref:Cyanovirin-N domain-containing protein n=1 Tax=Mycena pura TaxID=153505 RepID=A0AAD6YL80_9AGAR|nr:hypothetical protein GGX14DRAFT_388386 [Mycena pura]